MNEVPRDGNCGYTSLINALNHIDVKCKKTVLEIRKDIWEFICNRRETDFKYIKFKDKDLLGIFQEGLKYTGNMAFWRWMDTSMLGRVISKLYNVNFYVYYDDSKMKRTTIYRPNDDHTCDEAGFVSIGDKVSDGPLKVVRFYFTTTNDAETAWNHLTWVALGPSESMETEVDDKKDGGDDANDAVVSSSSGGGGGGEKKDVLTYGEEEEETHGNEDGENAVLPDGGEAKTVAEAPAATAAVMPGVTIAPDAIGIDLEYEEIRLCPPTEIGRNWGEQIHAHDRMRGIKHNDKSPSLTYPAKLGVVFLLDENPWEAVVYWNDYQNLSNQISVIPYADIEFENELGKGRRIRKRPDKYVPGGKAKRLSEERTSRSQQIVNIINLVKSEEVETQADGSQQIIDLELELGRVG